MWNLYLRFNHLTKPTEINNLGLLSQTRYGHGIGLNILSASANIWFNGSNHQLINLNLILIAECRHIKFWVIINFQQLSRYFRDWRSRKKTTVVLTHLIYMSACIHWYSHVKNHIQGKIWLLLILSTWNHTQNLIIGLSTTVLDHKTLRTNHLHN